MDRLKNVVIFYRKNGEKIVKEGTYQLISFEGNKIIIVLLLSAGWVDCWSVPLVALSIQYTYHPMPPLGPDPQADITTPEKEEILLSPMRIPKLKSPALKWVQTDAQLFDPTTLQPDKVSVDIEIGSSILLAYGTVLRNFINLKVKATFLWLNSEFVFNFPSIGKHFW